MGKDKIGFVGAGNMATALVKGLINSGLYDAGRLIVSDKEEEKSKSLSERFGAGWSPSNIELVRESAILVLCVKPQSMGEVLEEIRDDMKEGLITISIAAGIPIKMIRSVVGRDIPIIRVMPNTPALIQKGMSALAPGKGVTPGQMDTAKKIFDAVGETVIVGEEMMDAVTALSGSGPGFLFRILECFVEAGEGLGFDRDTSIQLVLQTALGAAQLAGESEKTLSELREMVTSPGGTTAAGLDVFERSRLGRTVQEAVEAAYKRGAELGKVYGD